ncbi:MAG TPA: hypothetical protein PK971_00950 [Saprospiraceae bacterium]|nr:hypothetical protein [Saprospiraceae bacterium]HND86859.1 hypothetical protein [Saprospiraceae bacterium]HNG90807.1 hypothetical protein [Saprospiraceae bacterium]
MQFVDVKNEIAFGKIFGQMDKKITRRPLLDAMPGWEGDSRMTDMETINLFPPPFIKRLGACTIALRSGLSLAQIAPATKKGESELRALHQPSSGA